MKVEFNDKKQVQITLESNKEILFMCLISGWNGSCIKTALKEEKKLHTTFGDLTEYQFEIIHRETLPQAHRLYVFLEEHFERSESQVKRAFPRLFVVDEL